MGTGMAATVTVDPNTTVGTIGPGFASFSYEKKHLTNASLTSANTAMIGLHKLLGAPLLRIGANDVNNCHYAGMGPPATTTPTGMPFTTNITSGMIDQLCGFLAQTGTKIIYGVNFQTSADPGASSDEAAYAQGACPQSIYGFEIGNELPNTWPSNQVKWDQFADAIVAKAPTARFVGPVAFSGGATFTAAFAAFEAPKRGNALVLLSQHYYAAASGSANATVSKLQTVDQTGLVAQDTMLGTAAVNNKIPDGYRIAEGNSFSGHGTANVSDTLISALWVLDFFFQTASHGGSGVNLHGGETGMDGTKPFYYTPIEEQGGVVFLVHPEYYGMLLFVLAGTGPMISTTATITPADAFLTAYAVKASGFTSVVLDNKDPANGINATVNLGASVSSASAIYLQGTPAGSLTAPAGAVTLSGAQVSNMAQWSPNPPYIQTVSGNTVSVYVPPATAALVHVLP
jgi:hypothetical protein